MEIIDAWKDFPEDIIIEILYKLPVKSLQRFKVVCKAWYNLFKDPSFITNHSLSRKKENILEDYARNTSVEKFLYMVSADKFDATIKLDLLNIDPPIRKYFLMGESNGLLCIDYFNDNYSDGIAVWNPAIRKIKFLPKPIISLKNYFQKIIGINADLKSNTYQVVTVMRYIENREQLSTRVEIYHKGQDNWRELLEMPRVVDTILSSSNFKFEYSSVAFDGAIYWGAKKKGDDLICGIISFNIRREQFHVVDVPDFEHIYNIKGWPIHYKVCEFKESLAIISTREGKWLESESIVDIWIKQNGDSIHDGPWMRIKSITFIDVRPLFILDGFQQLTIGYRTISNNNVILLDWNTKDEESEAIFSEEIGKKHAI